MNKLIQNCLKINKLNNNLQIFSKNYHILRRNYCFKSDLSLEKIYPNSNLRLYTPAPPQPLKDDKFNGYIPLDKVEVTYSRSSGPGGQNVNMVNTKVDLRIKIEEATWLAQKTRERLAELHKTKISKDGYFIIKSDLTRSQQMNLAYALEKFRRYVREAEQPVSKELSAETVEKLRRRQEKASRERLMVKRYRSDIKSGRQAPTIHD
uniref:Large ribosomal subunit protein mL62 n=1 Tax=Corethrella appendiculata TaxID=1370023 RepID=U5EV93_9DIPT